MKTLLTDLAKFYMSFNFFAGSDEQYVEGRIPAWFCTLFVLLAVAAALVMHYVFPERLGLLWSGIEQRLTEVELFCDTEVLVYYLVVVVSVLIAVIGFFFLIESRRTYIEKRNIRKGKVPLFPTYLIEGDEARSYALYKAFFGLIFIAAGSYFVWKVLGDGTPNNKEVRLTVNCDSFDK